MTPGNLGMDNPDLTEVASVLTSARVRSGCLKNLSTLDGFLAAIVAGPVWISPEEWLPRIFGAGDPEWTDPNEAERVCNAILARYEQLVRQLEENPDGYMPIFRTPPDGAVVTADWARGFLIGVDMRAPFWDALTKSAKGMRYFTTIFAQQPDWDRKVMASLGKGTVLEFRRQGQKFIPFCVNEIRSFWAERRGSCKTNSKTVPGPMVN